MNKKTKNEKKDKKKKAKVKLTQAQRADRHVLYEMSVQDTEAEFEFIDDTFYQLRGRRPVSLREDFCGTANMCCEWVRQRRNNTAVGVDLDPEVLAWGEARHLDALQSQQRERVSVLQKDVLKVKIEPVDVITAMNFSYQIFKDRAILRRYFRRVKQGLVEDGVFILDSFGGYNAFRELKEKTKHKNVTYIWEQARYNPVSGEILCHIHYTFADGSKLKRAFTYDWRLWTLPELQEILYEVGFTKVIVYWQGTDKKSGEGNGVFEPTTVGDADPAWISFVTAEK